MTTLEAIIADLKQLPPEKLEEAHRFVQQLKPSPLTNEELAAETMKIAGMLSHWSEEEWADFQAELARTRAELFTRPNPFMEDEPADN